VIRIFENRPFHLFTWSGSFGITRACAVAARSRGQFSASSAGPEHQRPLEARHPRQHPQVHPV